ncbi:MAG: ATP-binding protein [Acidobacteriota bacterium]|nr:ATP-binding protein [Acidobacteriota bacterium]
MQKLSVQNAQPGRPARFRSLASKFSLFTVTLVFWMVATILAYDLRQDTFDVKKGLLLLVVVLLVAGAISRFTIRLLARPLSLLGSGIQSVGMGRLDRLQVSPTGDEIEILGENFNKMIDALAASRAEVREHQELLEQRIKQRTEELEEVAVRAAAASHAKSEFLANMSHELRTPMNGIIGMLDITLDSRLMPDQVEQLATAQRCAYSLLSLLNDILDLSKIEAGKMVLERVPFSIRAMVEDCVRGQQPNAARQGDTLELEIAPEVPSQIVGDPLRIRQILSNLLNNAVKFTERGSVRVKLDSRVTGADTLSLELTVVDTGTGIPADKLPFIFDKFTQADGSVSRKYGGTGLGLAITKSLVEMHGGKIRLESQLDQGTTFYVTLNAQTAGPEVVPAPVREPAPRAESAGTDHPARILIVEDNAVNQKVVMTVLRKRGFAIEVASHGQEAMEALEREQDFNLILMDVQMPVMDGLEATRLIRQDARWKHIPIVAMTAHAMNGDRERCLAAGMDAYISKPVHPSQLLAIVDQNLFAGRPS